MKVGFGSIWGLMLAALVIQLASPLLGETESTAVGEGAASQSIQCEKYDHKCDPERQHCPTVENCTGLSELPQQCYASWTNNSDGIKFVFKGCWVGDICIGQKECILKNYHASIKFCCCDRTFCNRKINYSVGPVTTTIPSTPTVIRKQGGPQLIRTVMYSIVPLFGFAFIIVVVFWMWRRHQRSYNSHEPLPTIDPALSTTPSETALYPLQLIELRARGRFGSVWKAQLWEDYVAVKIFPLQDKHSWSVEQEIYNLAHMKHDNILNFIAVEKRGDNLNIELWLITEFHELGSLGDYLKGNTVTWSEMCKIAETMALGLAYLHDEIPASKVSEAKPAVAHRDFKSKNVLIKSDLSACIADFGLALKFEPGKSPGETHGLVGTRRYMAPEILEGAICFNRDAFLRIDMYACGLVLWEIMTRCSVIKAEEYQLPFEEEIGLHPTLEQMQDLVVVQKVRPAIKDHWLTHPNVEDGTIFQMGLSLLVSTVEECWDKDAEARLSAGCVHVRISQLARSVNASTSASNLILPSQIVVIPSGELPLKDIPSL